jgi:hypothetical protein
MRPSIRDIVVAIAFGDIVYRFVARSPYYRERTYLRPSERPYRLRSMFSALGPANEVGLHHPVLRRSDLLGLLIAASLSHSAAISRSIRRDS